MHWRDIYIENTVVPLFYNPLFNDHLGYRNTYVGAKVQFCVLLNL